MIPSTPLGLFCHRMLIYLEDFRRLLEHLNHFERQLTSQARAGRDLLRELAIWARYVPGFHGALAQQVGGPWNYFWDDSGSTSLYPYAV